MKKPRSFSKKLLRSGDTCLPSISAISRNSSSWRGVRFFGVSTDGVAYQFGNAFWNAPFWLVSQLVAVRGNFDHFQAGQVAVTIASNCAVLVTLYLGWRIGNSRVSLAPL